VLKTRGAPVWGTGDSRLKVRVTLPSLRAFELKGAGHVSLIGLAGGELEVVLSGAGDIEASGRVDRLAARVNGAGRVDLSHLVAGDADVSVNGAGSLEVQATGRLDAMLNGVGSIEYLGKPAQLNTSIHGVGNIGPKSAP
jgi:hypothetical protein